MKNKQNIVSEFYGILGMLCGAIVSLIIILVMAFTQ